MNGNEWLFGNEGIQWVQQAIGLGHPLPFRILSLLGDTWGIILVVGLARWLYGRRTTHALLGIVLVGAATKLLLSQLFYQQRPEGAGIVVYEQLEISSFPSGHVFAAIGPWGLLYLLGCLPLWVPVTVSFAVALGRIYLGTHYLGDVLGAAVFGIPLVWVFHRFWPSIERFLGARRSGFGIAVATCVVLATAVAWAITPDPHPRRYEIYGMVLGAALAVPLESRLLDDGTAGSRRFVSRLVRGAVGGIGIVLLFMLDTRVSDELATIGAVTAGAATIWALLIVPGLFERGSTSGNRRRVFAPLT